MKKITQNIRRVKIIGILFLVLSLAPLPGEKALAWETWGSIPMGVGMTTVIDQLMIVITGAAQQASAKMSLQSTFAAVSGGGGGGGPKFITDWTAALETDAQEEAASYIESMSSNSTQMKGSSFYESADDSAMVTFEGVGADGLAQYFRSPRFIDSASAQAEDRTESSNYAATLKDIGQGVTDQASNGNPCAVTYQGNPNNMFADGTFKNFSQFMSGNNNPWSYQTCIQKAYEDKLASLKEIAKTKAIAYQGFIGTGQNGMVSYPGSLIKERVANVEKMGNDIIANADGIAKVITSAVIKMGMDAMNNGIGNVKAQIQKNVTNVSNKATTQMQNQVDKYGPGAMYGNSSTAQ